MIVLVLLHMELVRPKDDLNMLTVHFVIVFRMTNYMFHWEPHLAGAFHTKNHLKVCHRKVCCY
jgi:hypothetical protein